MESVWGLMEYIERVHKVSVLKCLWSVGGLMQCVKRFIVCWRESER